MKIEFEIRAGNVMEDLKAQAYLAAIKEAKGNPYFAATWLGVTHTCLVSNLAKYGYSDLVLKYNKFKNATNYAQFKPKDYKK